MRATPWWAVGLTFALLIIPGRIPSREHLAKDDLVGWGWHPGEGRNPAPGSQQQLGELVRYWIDTGAACP
jgi:hypothetical protein